MTLEPFTTVIDVEDDQTLSPAEAPTLRPCGCPIEGPCLCGGPRLRIFDPMGRLLMSPVYY